MKNFVDITQLPSVLSEITDRLEALERRSELPEQPEEPVDIYQAARFLGLSRQAIYNLCHSRKLPHSKTGRHLRFFRSELQEWVKNHRRYQRKEGQYGECNK